MSPLLSGLRRLSYVISRSHEDSRLLGDRPSTAAKITLITLLFVALGAVFLPAFISKVSLWSEGKPQVLIPRSSWKVIYADSSTPCGPIASIEAKCLADPEHSELWTSSFRRTDPEHMGRLRKIMGRTFWIGTSIPRELLEQAKTTEAFNLLVGYINGSYRVWVDGILESSGDFQNGSLPILLPVTKHIFSKNDLKIAIEIHHDAESAYPDFLGGAFGEGFVRSSNATLMVGKLLFFAWARPLSFFAMNLLIAALFTFFWSPTKKKQEYAYMALYALVHALIQARQLDYVFRWMGYLWVDRLDVVLRYYEGGLGMFLAFSFARLRRDIFAIGVPLMLLTPVGTLFLYPDTTGLLQATQNIGKFWVPTLYLLGALACLVQFGALREKRASGAANSKREGRLLIFGLTMLGMAVVYEIQASGIASADTALFMYRVVHFGLVALLGGIIVMDYREAEHRLEAIPLSEYHRRVPLPSALSGLILNLDLKGSTLLHTEGARLGAAGLLVSRCTDVIKTVIRRNGGTITHHVGDEIKAFFDSDKLPRVCEVVQTTVQELDRQLASLSGIFVDEGLFAPGFKLAFRAGLAEGQIKPTLETRDGVQEPGWEEAGHTNPYVRADRLMKAEKMLCGSGELDPRATHVAIEFPLKQKFQNEVAIKPVWLVEEQAHKTQEGLDLSFGVLALSHTE